MFDDRDNTILITGRCGGNGIDLTNGHGYDDVFLVKLDTAANFIWGKLYGTALDEAGYGICKGTGKTYLLAGEAFDNVNVIDRGLLLNIDSAGNALDQKIITGNGGVTYNGMFPYRSAFAALGISYSSRLSEGTGINCPYKSIGSGALVLSKLDVWKTEVPLIAKNNAGFMIAPNPIHASFEVRLDGSHPAGELQCLNVIGQIVFRKIIAAFTTTISISTVEWIPGNYVMYWRPNGQPKQGRCSVILGNPWCYARNLFV
jgi:hypothetical protein